MSEQNLNENLIELDDISADEATRLEIWLSTEKTDPRFTKKVTVGRPFTTINSQYQIRNATRLFGPMGIDWGVKNEVFEFETMDPGRPETRIQMYSAILYYTHEGKKGEIGIYAETACFQRNKEGGYKVVDDMRKKLCTDALTKGLSKLGFNADVFLGLYDDNKYVMDLNDEFKGTDKTLTGGAKPEDPKPKYQAPKKENKSPQSKPQPINTAKQDEENDRIKKGWLKLKGLCNKCEDAGDTGWIEIMQALIPGIDPRSDNVPLVELQRVGIGKLLELYARIEKHSKELSA